jgi:hypothetical protein
MELFLINQTFIFLINLIGIWLAFWVLFTDRKTRINQLFFLTTIFILFWVDFSFLSDLPSQVYHSLLWNRLIFGTVSLFFIVSYFFSIYFPKKITENRFLTKLVITLCSLLFLISVFSNLVVKDVAEKNGGRR